MIGYAGLNQYYYKRSIRPNLAVASPAASPLPAAVTPTRPIHISIPGLIDQPLEPQTYQNGKWTVSERTGSYLGQSAKPGENGNIIIYGHNRRQIFAELSKVTAGAVITLTTEDNRQHAYQVSYTVEVTPDRVESLQPTNQEVLTVYTCSGWLDSKRFVVRAEPVR